MLQSPDSIANQQTVIGITADSTVQKSARPQTPYQVLRMLPKNATPEQQDSAIQVWFQPGEIHYSGRPDTLHLPGHDAGHNPKEVELPIYYQETFFSKDSLLHPELTGGRSGIAGDPVPYTVRGDDAITGMLLFCFVTTLVVFSRSRHFLVDQLKNIFFIPRAERSFNDQASSRVYFQLFLNLLTSLLLAITYYFYLTRYIADTFIYDEPYQLIGVFFGVFVVYFLLRTILYQIVNSIFFESKKSSQWTWEQSTITALEGIVLFPAVVLQVYFGLSLQSVAYYFIFILLLTKILTFFKLWAIFFRQTSYFLQIILYLCALEIIPLLSLVGVLSLIADVLKVNF